jgi:hypothetical protein
MVQATYEISGSTLGKPGTTSGTGFVLGIPPQGEAKSGEIIDGQGTSLGASPVFVTAAHVLNEIGGDIATLDMRVKEGETWNEVKIPLQIRRKGHPLWTHHPVADVAVLPLVNSRVIDHLIQPFVPTSWLATDSWLESFQIHPGDEVTCLGFPEAITSQFGFPILRTGRIASYPILPTLFSRPLYIDFPVYRGNSGGPAYIVHGGSRGNVMTVGSQELRIVGLVTMKQFANPNLRNAVVANPSSPQDYSHLSDMHLAVLEPATAILETINLLK